MPIIDIPFYGNLVLCLILVSAAYTLAMSFGAARGRTHMLISARYGTYATCALVGLAVCLLAYAFQTHDFRIRYVARYSDRSMTPWYLVASLWGGQDGSLLWWAFLLSGYTAAATRWLKGRYLELQPFVLATLMSIFIFFIVLMLFAANPFQTYVSTIPADGEGLNPLLQNYWMIIHPPSLYMGFVGWSVPFAFAISALATGRLHEEWIRAARLWAMIAWTFLSIGLMLGCLWSYEELGWGGYWAWDPVENASFMPWLVGTAYLHSAMIQERYGMMKVWNVFLMCLTFFMTIFGTFLTRSGMIASVHSFARSDIGIYFVYYMVFLIIGIFALIFYRLPKLKAEHRIVSLVSREFAFLLNNWVLLGMMVFVLVATTFPLISDFLRGEEVTVGPGFYNKWMVPFGIVLLFLAGIGPLISWRKATGKNLRRALYVPTVFAIVMRIAHELFGSALGLPPVVASDQIYDTFTGELLATVHAHAPVVSSTVCAFVVGSVAQEFWRGMKVRIRNKKENPFKALVGLVKRARRRYGGYLVHLGVVFIYIGFTGAAYDQEREAALTVGATMDVGDYRVRYDGPISKADPNKRMIFGKLTLFDRESGDELGVVTPAKFIYRTHPDMPTTEVAIRSRIGEDLYVIMSTIDPDTQRGTFRLIVRPLVPWIWFGGLLALFGSLISMWPTAREVMERAEQHARNKQRRKDRGAAATLGALLIASSFALSGGTAHAQSDSSSTLHAGTVEIQNPTERQLFSRLLCQCGDCARLPMHTCGCSWAEDHRAELRERLERGDTVQAIQSTWRAQYGPAALAIPSDQGLDRALWAVPVGGALLAIGAIFWLGRRWRDGGDVSETGSASDASDQDALDDALDDELRRLEDL